MTMSLCNHLMHSKNNYLYHTFSLLLLNYTIIILPIVVAAILVNVFSLILFSIAFFIVKLLKKDGSKCCFTAQRSRARN